MSHYATAFFSAVIAALLAVAVAITVMDNSAQQKIEQVRVDEFNAGWMDGYKDGKAGY